MTDRELLEKAAQAAGYELVGTVEKFIVQPSYEHIGGFIVSNNKGGHSAWNPLTDDGDALRLAVKLGIDLQLFRAIPQEFRPHDLFARACVDRMGRCFGEQVVDDPGAAARRAIVRAAAALGASMTPNAKLSGPNDPQEAQR